MTKEQEIVRSVFDAYIRDAKATSTKKDRPTFDMLEEVKNMAIKALEQQPSDDCVSRAEVLNQLKEWRDCEFVKMTNPYHYLEKRIQSMPPVTPTRKVGKWIKSEIGGAKVCSICQSRMGLSNFKYCPNCGAEMRGNNVDKKR